MKKVIATAGGNLILTLFLQAVPIDAYLDISNSSLINKRMTASDSVSITAEHEGRRGSVEVSAATVETALSYSFTANGEVSASIAPSKAYALAGCEIDPAGYWNYIQPTDVSLNVHNPYNDVKTYVFKEPMTFTGSYSMGGSGTIPSFKAFLAEEDGLLNWNRGNGTFSVWDPFYGSQTLEISIVGAAYAESFYGTVSPGIYKIGAAAVWAASGSDLQPRKGSMAFTVNFTPAPTQPSIGSVTEASGTTNVIRNGMTFPFVTGDAAYAGDIVETASNSYIKLVLVDESKMTVGSDSRMKVEKFGNESVGVINLLKGTIRAEIKKSFDALDPKAKAKLFIKTNSGGFGIRGTEFEVSYSELDGVGISTLNVIEGVVELIDYHLGKVTRVMAGQSGTVAGPVDNWMDEGDYEAIPTLAPEIVVFDSGSDELTSGQSEVDWGAISMGGNAVEKSFLIRNIWTSDLTNISISITGKDSADFVVIGPATNQLPGGAGTDFTVKFKPTASGRRTAKLQIVSNDGDENPFDIALVGSGLAAGPEIVVMQPLGSHLTDGTSKKSFGTVKVGKASTPKTFTIQNAGTGNLTGISVSLEGKHAADYMVTKPGKTSLEIDATTTFKVTFKPKAKGTRIAVMRIKSNDLDENPFDIFLSGAGVK